MQVPPRFTRSMRATFQPRSANLCDSGFPAWPDPMTIASNFIALRFLLQPLEYVITHAKRIGHDGKRRIHGAARREETAVNHIQVINVMRLTICVKCGRLRVAPEANRAVLMCHTCQRNPLSHEQVSREETFVTFMSMNVALGLLLHQAFELGDQPLMPLVIIDFVFENYFPFTIYGHAVVRIGQVFRREPEIERMRCHEIQCPARRNCRRSARESDAVEFSDERDVTHGEIPFLGAE